MKLINKIGMMPNLQFLVLMYVLALAMRLVLVFGYGQLNSIELYEPLIIGKNIAEGSGFALHWPYNSFDELRYAVKENTSAPSYGTTFIPPIVPYIYAGYISLFGLSSNSLLILMLAQSVIGAFLPLIVYWATKQFFGDVAARWSAIVCLAYLPVALTAITFSGAVFYPIVALGIMWCLGILFRKKSTSTFILLGVFSGMLSLMRSEFYYIFFIMAIAIIVLWFKEYRLQLKAKFLLLMIMAFLIGTCWWGIRNYMEFGRIIPVTGHPWREMWRGYNPYATGSGSGANGFNLWENQKEYAHITRALDSIPLNNEFEEKADKIYKREVVGFIQQNTGEALFLAAKKVLMFWTIDVYYEKAKHPLYIVPQLLVCVLSVVGVYYLLRENKKILLPWVILFVCYSGVFALTYVLPRYQSYVFPMYFPLCGYALFKLFNRKEQSTKYNV